MYKLSELPYGYDSLEPFIDTHTLGLHKNKHQKNYLNKLNELLVKNNYDFKYPIIELPFYINKLNINNKEDIMFNLGGVINHDIYFNSMSKNKTSPNSRLMEEIINRFDSFENFIKEFKEKALSIKGSGYTFLVINNGSLDIINLLNQDNPYNYGYTPLLGIDMWEHAFYINYENKKDIYIDNFFEVIDFKNANDIFNNFNYKT